MSFCIQRGVVRKSIDSTLICNYVFVNNKEQAKARSYSYSHYEEDYLCHSHLLEFEP